MTRFFLILSLSLGGCLRLGRPAVDAGSVGAALVAMPPSAHCRTLARQTVAFAVVGLILAPSGAAMTGSSSAEAGAVRWGLIGGGLATTVGGTIAAYFGTAAAAQHTRECE